MDRLHSRMYGKDGARPDNMGILVRYQENDSYYIFAIMNGRQRAEIWSRVAGTYKDEKDTPFPNELNRDYNIKKE